MGGLAGCSASPPAGRPVVSFGADKIVVTDPVDRARVQMTMGQFGSAIELLQSALHREPQSGRIFNLLAVAYDKIGRADLADRYFAESLQTEADATVTLNNWGYSKLLRGDRAGALDLFQQAAAKTPDNPVVQANLALVQGDATQSGTGMAVVAGLETPVAPAAHTDTAPGWPARSHIQVLTAKPSVIRQAAGVQLLVTTELAELDSRAARALSASGGAASDPLALQTYASAPAFRDMAPDSQASEESQMAELPQDTPGIVAPVEETKPADHAIIAGLPARSLDPASAGDGAFR
jgi:tetratricopeptide (TPR) repeat protein